MNTATLKRAGIRFSYSCYAVFPQIPYVQDVLYILQLSGEKDAKNYYSPDGAGNWSTYIANAVLVAAAVANQMFSMERYDVIEARRIIARAIVELCPEEAKCLFNDAFVQAKRLNGEPGVPLPSADRETLQRACTCPRCREEEYQFGGHDASIYRDKEYGIDGNDGDNM